MHQKLQKVSNYVSVEKYFTLLIHVWRLQKRALLCLQQNEKTSRNETKNVLFGIDFHSRKKTLANRIFPSYMIKSGQISRNVS